MRTYNLREVKPLRNLDPQHIDQMVALRGMVIRTSQIIPDLKQAFFRCIVCNAAKEVRKIMPRFFSRSSCVTMAVFWVGINSIHDCCKETQNSYATLSFVFVKVIHTTHFGYVDQILCRQCYTPCMTVKARVTVGTRDLYA